MSGPGRSADDRERRLHARHRLLAAAAVDGRIDPEDAAELEAHLLTCRACSAAFAAMRADHRLLAEPARVTPPDPRVRTAILDAARGPRVPRVGPRPRTWPALLAAGLIVAVIGTGILLGLRRPSTAGSDTSPPSPRPTAPASTAAASSCVPIPPGLSARWHFDSPGEYLTGQPIELGGTFDHADGISASALGLTGDAGTATVTDPERLQFGAEDLTISIWVRFATIAGEQVLLERYGEAPLLGWSLAKTSGQRIRFAVVSDAGRREVESTSSVVAGPWQHVAIRRAGNSFSLIVNGVAGGNLQLDTGVGVDLDSELPLLFGRAGNSAAFDLDGDLDEVLVWNGRALDEAQILELRRAGADGFCEAAAGIGYEGTWAAVDCATSGRTVDCDRSGDRSNLRLLIGPGETPTVTFEDDAVDGCGPAGAAGATGPRAAAGTGRFDGVYLWVDFDAVDCSAPAESWINPMQLYKGLGDPSIWFDPDGDAWGLVYRPG